MTDHGPRPLGLVGAGAMGSEIALRAARRGLQLRVYDRDAARLRALAGHDGVETVDRLDALAGVRTVVCLLPNSDVVDSVVAGPDGLLDVLAPDALIIDMGSSDPRRTRALAERAERAGVGLVDAPVSGGLRRARTGELTIMFGGDERWRERCQELFDAVASQVFPMGAVGSGHTMKALNNLVSATSLSIACEAIEIGRRRGLDPWRMLEALNHSTGASNATETKVGQFVLSETYGSGFTLALMLKDVSLAADLAEAEHVTVGLSRACRDLWARAAEHVVATADQTEIVRVWEQSSAANQERAATLARGADMPEPQRKDTRA